MNNAYNTDTYVYKYVTLRSPDIGTIEIGKFMNCYAYT